MMKEKERLPKKHMKKFLAAGAVVLALAGIIIDSRFRLTVSEYTLSFDKLPESFRGFRIVQLSDLHMMQFGEDNSRLLSLVSEQRPDIIVLTGDFINRSNGSRPQAGKLRPFLRSLSELAPCFFVSGNHDWASGEIYGLAELLDECGIDYLRNEYILLEHDGDSVVLAGAEDPNGWADMPKPPEFIDSVRQENPDKFLILLGHRDNWMDRYPDLDADLIFCGHGHGGVVRLPFIGGVFGTEFNLFPKYDGGVFNNGNYDLVVSRGLGNANPIPRFLNPPEIVTVILEK